MGISLDDAQLTCKIKHCRGFMGTFPLIFKVLNLQSRVEKFKNKQTKKLSREICLLWNCYPTEHRNWHSGFGAKEGKYIHGEVCFFILLCPHWFSVADVCDCGSERKGFVHRICIFVLLNLPYMKENYFHTVYQDMWERTGMHFWEWKMLFFLGTLSSEIPLWSLHARCDKIMWNEM